MDGITDLKIAHFGQDGSEMKPEKPSWYNARQEMAENILDQDGFKYYDHDGYKYFGGDDMNIYITEYYILSIMIILCCTGLCCLLLSILMGLIGGYMLNKKRTSRSFGHEYV